MREVIAAPLAGLDLRQHYGHHQSPAVLFDDAVQFLASDAASFITGAVVVCDGGQSLAGLGVSMMAAMRPRA